MITDTATCEVCGVPATEATHDIKEVPSDSEWMCWEPDGLWHYRCDDHPRASATKYLKPGGGYEVHGGYDLTEPAPEPGDTYVNATRMTVTISPSSNFFDDDHAITYVDLEFCRELIRYEQG